MHRLLPATLLLVLVSGLRASPDSLPFPPWIGVELSLPQAPELDRPAPVTLRLTALVAPLPGTRYEVLLPAGMSLQQGALSGHLNLVTSSPVDVHLLVRMERPASGVSIAARVT